MDFEHDKIQKQKIRDSSFCLLSARIIISLGYFSKLYQIYTQKMIIFRLKDKSIYDDENIFLAPVV